MFIDFTFNNWRAFGIKASSQRCSPIIALLAYFQYASNVHNYNTTYASKKKTFT